MILPPDKLIPIAELKDYTFDPRPHDWGKLLAPFSPPLPLAGQVIVASLFGDVFVEDSHGAVWWVNGVEERVDRIGISREQFLERVSREHLTMLKTKLMESLIVADKSAKAGMIYGLKTPRAEGGSYHPDNIGAASVEASFAYLGERFRAKNATPPPAQAPDVAPERRDKKSGLWSRKS